MTVTKKCRKVMKNISNSKLQVKKREKIKRSQNDEFSKLWGALDPPRPFLKKYNCDIRCQRNEER